MEFVKTFPHMKLPLPAVFVAILSCLLASCADTRHRLIVSAADQRMAVLEDDRAQMEPRWDVMKSRKKSAAVNLLAWHSKAEWPLAKLFQSTLQDAILL
jgi:hypothetical protein